MPYDPTLAEDVARAKAILAKGRVTAEDKPAWMPDDQWQQLRPGAGTIYGADIYVAYQLLRSFVAAIEAVGPKVCELALRHEAKRAEAPCVKCRQPRAHPFHAPTGIFGREMETHEYEPSEPEARPSIVCPRCGRRSYHPKDITERYCGACHQFHDEEGFA